MWGIDITKQGWMERRRKGKQSSKIQRPRTKTLTTVSQNCWATASAASASEASQEEMMHWVVDVMNASDLQRQFKSSEKQVPMSAFAIQGWAHAVERR